MWHGFGGSLKSRIAAVAGLLFLGGLGLITLIVTEILHDDMQDLVSRQQLVAASFIARDVDSKLILRRDSLMRVAENIPSALFADPGGMQGWLEDRRAINTLFPTGLMVIPPDGGPTLADTPRLATRPRSFVDRDWFQDAVAKRGPVFSKPLITRATGEPALVIAVPVFDDQAKMLGLLAGVTPLTTSGFLQLIVGARPSKLGSYQLISPRHGLQVLGSDLASAITPLPAKGSDPIIDQALAGARGAQVIRKASGEDELATLVDIPAAGWLLIARQPASEAFAAISGTLRHALLISLLLGIPVVILLLAALHRLLRPLQDLARDIGRMAEGTRPMLPVSAHGCSEVAQVGLSFNRLQDKLLEQEQRLARMAHHDTLTGLPNRRAIHERLSEELLRLDRSGHGLALLFLDLDGFKPANDTYGHQTGDLLLIEVARRLQASVRQADSLARLGGDEFLILLCATDVPLEAAERVARQCIASLGQPFVIDDKAISIGVSIGIASCSAEQAKARTAEQLINAADQAMYEAKANGRGRYVILPISEPSQEP